MSARYLLVTAALTLAHAAMAADAAGCKDSPIVPRFPGSTIQECTDKTDDAVNFENIGPKKERKRLEGELHKLNYNYPKSAQKAQVVQTLHAALQAAGFTFVYDSGAYSDFTATKGKTWIAEEVSGGGGYAQTTLTETTLTQEVTAKPADTADSYAGPATQAAKPAQAHPDSNGCKDSPLITRFPGSYISECKDKADEAYTFENIGPKKESKKIEGEIHQITYNYPSTASKAQVVRNLNTALRQAGYTFVYDSGDYGDFTVTRGKTWISEEVSASGNYKQTIMFETSLTQDVVANAAAMTNGLATSGHTVVNGILFDTAKSDIKPASAAALQEVAKMLQADPKLKVFVVGHTDNVGALAANLELSRQRAAAVVKALTTQYSIAADRLQSYGDGPYAPVGSNDTEDGRALNRRVELVKQ
jgi:outer membrane protein OmpA-like peptidoglycan-associated protein